MSEGSSSDRPNPNWAVNPFILLFFIGLSVDLFATLRAVYWIAIGKRLRGRIALTGIAAQSSVAYGAWIKISEKRMIEAYLAEPSQPIELSVLVAVTNAEPGSGQTDRTIESIVSAFGSAADVRLVADRRIDPGFFDVGAEGASRWLLVLSSGDVVSPSLKSAVEQAISNAPAASVVHWDADHFGDGRRRDPLIKPMSWDGILHAQVDCLSSMSLIRLDKAVICWSSSDLAGSPVDFRQLISCVVEKLSPQNYVHVPLILTHFGERPSTAPSMAVSLQSLGFPAPKNWPSVTMIIPTRDRVELLSECISSLAKTEYQGELKVAVVDNGSEEPTTKAYLESMTKQGMISVIKAPGPFNFSHLNNLAVAQTDGEFICLLNNDVTVTQGDWLASLVTVGAGEDIGAVGPMLLYPDGTIQHAGVAIGVGNAAGHIQRGVQPDTEIMPTWTRATRQVSAVTAACLLVRRADYLMVGGLNEDHLAVAFNDVDFCLKLQEAGRRNIYVATVALVHHESKSRGSDLDPANFKRFAGELSYLQQRWSTQSHQDPWYSPLFSRSSERCAMQL